MPHPADTPAPSLLDAPLTERDWHAWAWRRLQRARPTLVNTSLDDALADPVLAKLVAGFAAQLRHEQEARERLDAKARRWGVPVRHNGYGYVPVRK